MRKSYFLPLVAVATFLMGCVRENTATIVDGVYREPTGVGSVTVQGRNMTVQLNMTKGLRPGLQSRRYTYELMNDGQVALSGSSNDEFFLFAVVGYEWLWDGKNVIRKQKQSGETTVFSRDGQN